MKNMSLLRRLEKLEQSVSQIKSPKEDLSHLSIEELKFLLDKEVEKASSEPLQPPEYFEANYLRECGRPMPEHQRKWLRGLYDQIKNQTESVSENTEDIT